MFNTVHLVTFIVVLHHSDAVVNRPRGVSISMAPLYEYNADNPVFNCLDKSNRIPYTYINDDYCDCADGSDEPGTSACPNGRYNCLNVGHVSYNIRSSRVNDGICDCCDGSDEYDQIVSCSNNCQEMGKLAREEAEREKQLIEEGYKIRVSYSENGKKAIQDTKDKLIELETLLTSASDAKTIAENKKTDAEAPEKEAKDAHNKLVEEEKAKREQEADAQRCVAAFDEIDVDKNGLIDSNEMMFHPEFDIDNNSVVSQEEANEYMSDTAEANLNHFTEKMWAGIKDIYKPLDKREPNVVSEDTLPGAEVPQTLVPPPIPEGDAEMVKGDKHGDENDEDDYKDDYKDDKDDDKDDDDDDDEDVNDRAEASDEDDYKTPDDDHSKETKDEKDESVIDYDEQTKLLMKVADDAREEFRKADDEVKRVEQEIQQSKQFLEMDLGPDREFYPLKNECYELNDKEYTYVFCPFNKASQKSKSGGSETSLGTWGSWTGPDDDKYSSMTYERGQNCWNGPDRSVKVELKCGMENKLLSASEPSRCEYHYVFTTPARCTHQSEFDRGKDPHDEL